MSETILNIAYDPSNETWDVDSLRILIKEISQDESIVMHIITKSADSKLIEDVQLKTGIEAKNTIIAIDDADVIAKLQENKCVIFLSSDSILGRLVDKNIPLDLKTNNVSGTKFIEFNGILDHYHIQPKPLTNLTFWADQIRKYADGKEIK